MGKLGSYEYPELTLQDTLAVGRRIAREFMGSVSRSGLARALGMSEKGGSFGARIGALRIWGVAEGRGTIRLTQEGLRAVNPLTDEESDAARGELASSVRLLSLVAERLGDLPPDRTRLAIILEEITGANRMEVEKKLPHIERVVEEALPLLKGRVAADAYRDSTNLWGQQLGKPGNVQTGQGEVADKTDAAPEARRAFEQDQAEQDGDRASAGSRPKVDVYFQGGRISLPETPASLDVIIQVLQERREKLARGEDPNE